MTDRPNTSITVWGSVWRALLLAIATGAASTVCINILARADGVGPISPSGWAWGFVLMYFASLVPAVVTGWAATRVRGSWFRRWGLLSGVVIALCVGAGMGSWVLLSIPGDDPYALPNAPHFWETLSASILIPALAGAGVLAHWTADPADRARPTLPGPTGLGC